MAWDKHQVKSIEEQYVECMSNHTMFRGLYIAIALTFHRQNFIYYIISWLQLCSNHSLCDSPAALVVNLLND